MSEWFEDEIFWRVFHPILFPESKFAEADLEIKKLLTLIDFQGQEVLDLCCGTGRHAIALAKLGMDVTAVDCTAFLLNLAQERAAKENVKVEWVHQDIREFHPTHQYDLVINWMTSLGYFEKESENLNVLDLAYTSLKKGGVAVLDLIGKEIVAKNFKADASMQFEDGTVLVERQKITDDWCRLNNEWIVIDNGEAQTYSFSHSIYTGRELKGYLLSAGFREVKLFGSLDGTAYGPDSSRLITVAYK